MKNGEQQGNNSENERWKGDDEVEIKTKKLSRGFTGDGQWVAIDKATVERN